VRTDEYVRRYSAFVLEFMARYSNEVESGFFLRHLKPRMDLLEEVTLAWCEATGQAA
jgi:hypothetical protein